ncbi:MAG TPA: group I intron-associated PD-(D/E)XK endonuclease [Bryobacteraceae bacterium]|jgi:hypothetical protein|nr:group I intron-associated PD-(D/E)XK endonuclease [Bryobacteraceae bacterium]
MRLFYFPAMSKRSRRPTPSASRPNPARQRELNTKRRGELAELGFTLKAARLGFGVSRPFGDSERYDAIVDARPVTATRKHPEAASRKLICPALPIFRLRDASPRWYPRDPTPPLWRVQVKCSTQIARGMYHLNAHRRTGGRAVPYLPGEIDFLAAYIIPEDTWYIIPFQAFLGSTGLLFRRRADRKPGRYDAYREAWHLLRPQG